MEQSANLKLRGVDFEMDDEEEETDTQSVSTEVWNWYEEEVFNDTVDLLMQYANLDRDMAIDLIYNGGLKIYSAEYVPMQEAFENYLKNNWQEFTSDSGIWSGVCLMEYDGRILCVNTNQANDDNELFEKRPATACRTTFRTPRTSRVLPLSPSACMRRRWRTISSRTAPC